MPSFLVSLAGLPYGRATRVTAYVALAGLVGLAAVEAGATGASGATGPVGPIGPVGRVGPTSSDGGSSAQQPLPRSAPADSPAAHAPRDRAATARSGNRIEVTGNTATNVRSDCAGGSASVNQVDVDGRALQGRTVIVQGRNVENVQVPCEPRRSDQPGAPSTQINSVRIR